MYQGYYKRALIAALKLDLAALQENNRPYHSDMCGACRHVHGWRGSCDIPDAPIYVLSNDSFMSYWGESAGKINTCVVPCASLEEANDVIRYIESRSDQKYIRLTQNKPQPRHRKLSLMLSWRYNALKIDEPRQTDPAILRHILSLIK